MSTTEDDAERVQDDQASGASASSSTDSDNDDESESPAMGLGYMPLSQDPDLDDDNEDSGCLDFTTDSELLTGGTTRTDHEQIIEQSRHPMSPEDCVCTPTSTMEENQVDRIKQAMSGFSLPSTAIPEWAKHVPENVWKSELINGIRTKKDDK